MKTYANLLPLKYRRRQLLWLRTRQWLFLVSFAACLIACLAWTQWSQFRSSTARLESLRQQYAPVLAMQRECETLRQRIQELRQRETLVITLADEQSMLTLVGLLSRAARKCEGRVSVRSLQLERQEEGTAGKAPPCTLRLDGYAEDNEAVAQFAKALRDENTFHHVELKNTGTTSLGPQGSGTEAKTYQMECVF
jgi:Tfp pilus assembly protein PilN